MSADRLLADLRRRGLRAVVDGQDIVLHGPREALTPDVVAIVRTKKAELLATLNVPAESPRSRYAHPWPDGLAQLGMRRVGPFGACDSCGAGTWVRYGLTLLCLACAQARDDSASPRTEREG